MIEHGTKTDAASVESKWGLLENEWISYPYDDMEDEVSVVEGDLTADSWDQSKPQCVLVTGSLTVNGPIDLRMEHPGGFLVVIGDLQASQVDMGASDSDCCLYVGGSLALDGVLFAQRTGMVNIRKDVKCKALVAIDDYDVSVEGAVSGKSVAYDLEDKVPADQVFTKAVLDDEGCIDGNRVFRGEISAKTLEEALL